MSPSLIPAPARLSLLEGSVQTPPPSEWPSLDMGPAPAWLSETITPSWCGADARDAQSYTLRVAPAPPGRPIARITAPTAAALRHARATLIQLLRQYPVELPALEIFDRPAFATRGVMLDVSRSRIPTTAELLCIADTLAGLKCNHLQLYTEHTFAYAGHEAAWAGWDPITPAEVAALAEQCAALGIDLAPNQNCFGHLRHWLSLPQYSHLAETQGDWMFDVWPRSGPFSLCPTDPRSLDLVRDLLAQLIPCFRSSLVNIGCDETYDIAFGRSAGAVRELGRGAVFARFVAQVARLAADLGCRSMFWADIALSDPACLSLLPDDMIALAWGYEPDAPFDRWAAALHDPARSAGPRTMWACPGTSSWRSLTGRTAERRGNIDAAARCHAAEGFLTCDWGDSGHWQVWPVALLGIADGLSAAWSGPGAPSTAALSLHLFGDRTPATAEWLGALGDLDLPLRKVAMPLSRPGVAGAIRNQSALFADLFQPWDAHRDVGTSALAAGVRERLTWLAKSMPSPPDPLVRDELAHTLDMVDVALDRFTLRRGWASPAPADRLARRWADAKDRHAHLWLRRSRPGGLTHSTPFFDKVTFA